MKLNLSNGFTLVPFKSGDSMAVGVKRTTGLDVNAMIYTRYNSNNELELVLNMDVLNRIGASIVAETFDKSLPENSDKDVYLAGIIHEYGPDDIGLWEGFNLSDAEEQLFANILNKHAAEGCSVRGSKNDIAEEIKL